MRETLYRQMVYCINTYRTWIEVADDNLYKEHIISRTDRTDYLVSRTLVLRAFKTNGIHAEGTTWTIPEHELDKALAIYRKQDSTFKQRIKKAAMYFSPKDAETLIRLATYGVVQLGLIVRPTPMPENPITYVTEYPATHFLRDTFRGINIIVQEQQAVHGNLLRGNGTKRQRP